MITYLGLCAGGDSGRLVVLEMKSEMTGMLEQTYWNKDGVQALLEDKTQQGFFNELARALRDYNAYQIGDRLPMIKTKGPTYLVQGQLDL